VVRVVGAADTFGLAIALLGRPVPYEAVALEDAFLVMVPTRAVLALVENDPRFMRTVINALAERTVTLLGEVESGALRRGVQRLASYLDSLAVPNGSDGTFTVRLPTTKTVVASRLGVKKETLSRMLRELAQKGLIAVEQREIAILDRLGLLAVAREEA
jgi:CRP-like cAMP-binding protein